MLTIARSVRVQVVQGPQGRLERPVHLVWAVTLVLVEQGHTLVPEVKEEYQGSRGLEDTQEALESADTLALELGKVLVGELELEALTPVA